jgi:hypothetical protein
MSDAKSRRLERLASKTLDKTIRYYRMASERALSCILMLVKLAWALILVGQFGEAREELNRAIFVESHVDSMVHNVEVIRDVLDKEELIAYNKKQVESQLLYIKVAEQGRDVGN